MSNSPRRITRRSLLAGLATASGALLLSSLGCRPRRGGAAATPADPAFLDLRDASRAVRAGSISPVELTTADVAELDEAHDRSTPSGSAVAARQAGTTVATV
jgi:hypothetical protein